jgi:hypothetical protein
LSATVTLHQVFRLWLPLAGSWVLMGAEMPTFTAFVARMPEPEIQLAAWGSLVFPLSMTVEGPVIMLLAASTALAVDGPSYRKLLRYMTWMSVILTAVHVLLAFTPAFFWVAQGLLGVPEELLKPGQLGLQIMTPWTAAIAWRRLNQGVLIRYGNSRAVAIGTFIRLITLTGALWAGMAFDLGSGVFVGATAVALGVTFEAIFAHFIVQSVIQERLPKESEHSPITVRSFAVFYFPLALTPLLTLMIHPAGSAAISRMPMALSSLAAWPAVHGLVFLTRGMGFAFNEVVVALAAKEGGEQQLRRFAKMLAVGTMGLLALMGFTPLGRLWFGSVSGLSPELTAISASAIVLAIVMPGYQVYQSLYQGLLVHRRKTRGVSEAVGLYVGLALVGLWAGTQWATGPGIQWALSVFVLAGLSQTIYLRQRSRTLRT